MEKRTIDRSAKCVTGSRFVLKAHDTSAEQVLNELATERDDTFLATPFQRNAFLHSFYRHLPPNCTPLLVSVSEAPSGRLAMVLPLLKRDSTVLSYIEATDLGLSDYIAPVIADWFEPDEKEMRLIWSKLHKVLPPADILSLKKLPARLDRNRKNPLTLLPRTLDMGTTTKTLDLRDPECKTHYKRSGIYKDGMKKLRKLNTLGKVEYRMAETEEDAVRLFDALVEQRLSRFQTLERPDPLMDPEVQAFYTEVITRGVPSGEAMFGGLYLDGVCIATDLGLVRDDTHHGIITTMQSGDIQRYSPGTIVFMLMLDETVARGIGHYDIGVGEFFYKSRLTGTYMPLYERHEALSLRGRVALADARARRMIRLGLSQYPRLRKPVETLRHHLRRLRKWSVLAAAGIADWQYLHVSAGL